MNFLNYNYKFIKVKNKSLTPHVVLMALTTLPKCNVLLSVSLANDVVPFFNNKINRALKARQIISVLVVQQRRVARVLHYAAGGRCVLQIRLNQNAYKNREHVVCPEADRVVRLVVRYHLLALVKTSLVLSVNC